MLKKIQDVFCVELRMNQNSYEEYEEVESPYTKSAAPPRDRLRTRKNVFNRPFATEPTDAPVLVESKSTRRSIGNTHSTDMIERQTSSLADTEIEYLDEEFEEEEEEVVVRRPRTNTKKKAKPTKNLIAKIAWAIVGILCLRLVFMDRGVWDYFSTESVIQDKKDELQVLNAENTSLRKEIGLIKGDTGFQRNLAKEHLGVIAADEFLILFAGEKSQIDSEDELKSIY